MSQAWAGDRESAGVTRRCYELGGDVAAPREARTRVRQACAAWGVQWCDDAVVVASELVTNAIEHAQSDCQLMISLENAGLTVAVRDHVPGRLPVPNAVGGRQPRGRGLTLVAELSSSWGEREHADGKTVWATLPLAAPVLR